MELRTYGWYSCVREGLSDWALRCFICDYSCDDLNDSTMFDMYLSYDLLSEETIKAVCVGLFVPTTVSFFRGFF